MADILAYKLVYLENKKKEKNYCSIVQGYVELSFILEKIDTFGKEFVNPFNDINRISKLYLLHSFCSFQIP